MDTKTLLQKVRKIEIKTRRLSDHLFSGAYQTSFKGRGMSFAEVREYSYGDDVRTIDWNVTAKYQKPFVKIFEEERELTLMLLIDVSASGQFGSLEVFKKDLITEIAATLAFSATTNNDKIGAIFFSENIELFIPPKKGKTHVLRIIRELIEFQPKGKQTDLGRVLEYLNQVIKKKTIAFVLSDFISPNYEKPLKISAKKHDITAIRLFDIREKEMPNIGLVLMKDAESGQELLVDTSSKEVQSNYREHYTNSSNYFSSVFAKSGARIIECGTHENYVKKLLAYFKAR